MVNLEEKLREPIKENVRWQCVSKGEFFLSENAHNQEFMSKYPRNSSAVKFCLRKGSILRQTVNFSSSLAESESDSESFEAGGQMF